MITKNSYYLDFTTEQLLASRELLKSMPVLFNRIYFCKKYANALWSGETEEHFSCIDLLCQESDIASLRQIIKNNFLYIPDWDSIKNTNNEDYGFSFILGNVKHTIIPFRETDEGYEIRSYDSDTGTCLKTNLVTDKKFFLDTSINENGELVRTCAFNIEDITNENTTKEIAEKKETPPMAFYDKE